jgi:outer membrane protein OmpA-like peptidoglycan-associated protein
LSKPGALLAAGLVALTLAGCMTPRVQPAPSQAILEARAARDAKAQACADITDTPAVAATFGFQTAELSETAKLRLDQARHWLTCRPALSARVEARADQRGTEAEQTALARQRRAAITAYLVAGGVQPTRVVEASTTTAAQPAGADVVVIRGEGQGW